MEKRGSHERSGGGPQRIRNILSLEERVRAIEAYDRKPMYTKVASMFNCSWEQIKNIVQNRKAILDFYEATKANMINVNPDHEVIRQKKIHFLGECVYECIQRAQFHANANLCEEIIRLRACEFRELIQIKNFQPNKTWLNHFKATYNISMSQRQIMLTRTPPASLDLKDIMTYCSRNRMPIKPPPPPPQQNLYTLRTTMSVDSANNATLEEVMQRRHRKIAFLERVLGEYVHRLQFHYKLPLTDDILRKAAGDLKDMLKIDYFAPNKDWMQTFKAESMATAAAAHAQSTARPPPFSLDLKDIISYCSRENKSASIADASTRKSKHSSSPIQQIYDDDGIETRIPHNDDDDDGDGGGGGVNDSNNNNNNGDDDDDNDDNDNQLVMNNSNNNGDDDDDDDDDHHPGLEEGSIDIVDVKPSIDDIAFIEEPPLKIQKVESMVDNGDEPAKPLPIEGIALGGETSEPELPKHVQTYKDALRLLKPLEEFAMLEENFRAIGLISQLEMVFKQELDNLKCA